MNEIQKPGPGDFGIPEANLSDEEKLAAAKAELDQTIAQMQERAKKGEKPGDKEYFSEVADVLGQIRQFAENDREGLIAAPNNSKFFWEGLVERNGWIGLDQTVRELSRGKLRLELEMGNIRNEGAGIKILRNDEKISPASEPPDPRDS